MSSFDAQRLVDLSNISKLRDRSESAHSAWSILDEGDDVPALPSFVKPVVVDRATPTGEKDSELDPSVEVASQSSGRSSDTAFTSASFRRLPRGIRLSLPQYRWSSQSSAAGYSDAGVPAEAADATVHGWLNKMGGKAPYNWRMRYFAFEGETCSLLYFSREKSGEGYTLRGQAHVVAIKEHAPRPLLVFVVVASTLGKRRLTGDDAVCEREIIVRPHDIAHRNWWITQVRRCLPQAEVPQSASLEADEQGAHAAAVALQAAHRGRVVRVRATVEGAAACRLQASERGRFARNRRRFLAAAAAAAAAVTAARLSAAVAIQSVVRSRAARAEAASRRPVLSAWMLKQTPHFPYAWQERLVEVTAHGRRLRYYARGSGGRGRVLRGEATLTAVSAEEKEPRLALWVRFAEEKPGNTHGGTPRHTGERELLLRAPDVATQQEWLVGVNRILRASVSPPFACSP